VNDREERESIVYYRALIRRAKRERERNESALSMMMMTTMMFQNKKPPLCGLCVNCFITKTEVLFFLICALIKIVIMMNEAISLSLLKVSFFAFFAFFALCC